jgi:hypothetical protein
MQAVKNMTEQALAKTSPKMKEQSEQDTSQYRENNINPLSIGSKQNKIATNEERSY